MTLKEADDAAIRKVPIIHNGIRYTRITQIGYNYTALGRFPFIQLEDRSGHMVIDVKPDECVEAEKEVEEAEEKEYEKVERRVHKRRSNKR